MRYSITTPPNSIYDPVKKKTSHLTQRHVPAMRQFVIDELSPLERDNLESYLKRTLAPGPLAGIFWIALPEDLLAEAQRGHKECGPFYFGVEIDDTRVCFELLVRSQTNLHCTCIAYATGSQRQFVLDFIDRMLVEEQIRA